MLRILFVAFTLLHVANAHAQENVTLKAGAGKETVEAYCVACHSLDYPRMNSTFLTHQGWEAEVNKMIKVFGAPIQPADAKVIIDYLTANYGGSG